MQVNGAIVQDGLAQEFVRFPRTLSTRSAQCVFTQYVLQDIAKNLLLLSFCMQMDQAAVDTHFLTNQAVL